MVNADAGKATNLDADKLDGQDSAAFLGANQKAADSDKVDGLSSEQLGGAYAVVQPNATPSLETSRTSGFASVSRTGTGLYCLEPASGFQVRGRAVALSVDWGLTSSPEGNATALFNGNCGPNGISIRTERQSHSPVADNLISEEADDIGFHVVVP